MAGRVRRTPLWRILRVRNRRRSELDAPRNLGLVPVARGTQGIRDGFPHDFLLAPVVFSASAVFGGEGINHASHRSLANQTKIRRTSGVRKPPDGHYPATHRDRRIGIAARL